MHKAPTQLAAIEVLLELALDKRRVAEAVLASLLRGLESGRTVRIADGRMTLSREAEKRSQ